MARGNSSKDLAPVPSVPENAPVSYERTMAPNRPGNRGPLRYEEGLATDPDVPADFQRGAFEGTTGSPGHPSWPNRETQFKHADETMRERMHPGSASWVESPTYRSEFARDAMNDYGSPSYLSVDRSGQRYQRINPALVTD